MSAPVNRQEVPEPHRDWVGSQEVDAAPGRSLAKRARLWRPLKTLLEPMACTLARYAHRLIDRTTGIPYSADELQTKILAAFTGGSTDGLTVSDGTAPADAGKLGEYFSAAVTAVSAVPLSTGTATNIASIALTPGDWDVEAVASVLITSGGSASLDASISSTSATHAVDGFEAYVGDIKAQRESISLTRKRVLITANTTIYLVATATYVPGTAFGSGAITARRVR